MMPTTTRRGNPRAPTAIRQICQDQYRPHLATLLLWRSPPLITRSSECYPSIRTSLRGPPPPNPFFQILTDSRIAVEIASHIDIVTLDSLARTCRAARAGLLLNRKALLASTLRCHQDEVPVDSKDTFRYRARASSWFLQRRPASQTQGFNGKSGQCARDMVSECRKCSKVICRVSVPPQE